MNPLVDIIFFFVRRSLYKKTLQKGKRLGLLYYLRAVQVVRKSLVLALVLFFSLQMMVMGLIGAVATGIWLIPTDHEMKLWILFGSFAGIFLLPFAILCWVLSDRTWYRLSNAQTLVQQSEL